ncbi:MAG: RNA methyltransferase [Flavobacteriales bacterium]|nr:RNA methyltransferase [Flavobacteriales bacterium]
MNRKLKLDELKRPTLSEYVETHKFPVVLVLENVRSLNNIGSMFRTADACGIASIYLAGFTAKPPHKDINKTAIGATESVDWKYFENITDALDDLKKTDHVVYAVEQTEGSIKLNEMDWQTSEKIALVMGNELTGVEQSTIDLCDGTIEIPQFGTKHSFNVSVCAGLVLWDLISRKYL